MKKLILLFVLLLSSIPVFADTDYAYVSHVEYKGDIVEVTVSASPGAFDQFPSGFYVGLRPANNILDYLKAAHRILAGNIAEHNVTTRGGEIKIKLSPSSPSAKIQFFCKDDRYSAKACSRNNFVLNFRS